MPISYKLTQNQANLIIKHYKKYSTTPTNNYTLFLAKNKQFKTYAQISADPSWKLK